MVFVIKLTAVIKPEIRLDKHGTLTLEKVSTTANYLNI